MNENIHCSICGKDEELHWNKKTNQELRDFKMCFTCNFWREKVLWREAKDPRATIIKGCHYMANPEVKGKAHGFMGYGGHRFVIKYFDGRTVTTNDLWNQGDIPAGYWRDRLPDNAEFIEGAI